MLTPDYKKKLQSNNGHLYIKELREQILDELKLSSESEAKDL